MNLVTGMLLLCTHIIQTLLSRNMFPSALSSMTTPVMHMIEDFFFLYPVVDWIFLPFCTAS